MHHGSAGLGYSRQQNQKRLQIGTSHPDRTAQSEYIHDFELMELEHIAPYGVYGVNQNLAFVNLGTSCDTAEFAVNSVLL